MKIIINGKDVEVVAEGKEYIYHYESLASSILSDTYTISTLLFTFWFNHNFCGDSILLGIVSVILFFVLIFNFASEKKIKFTSKEKLIEYLQKKVK